MDWSIQALASAVLLIVTCKILINLGEDRLNGFYALFKIAYYLGLGVVAFVVIVKLIGFAVNLVAM